MKKNIVFSSIVASVLLLGTGCGSGSSSTSTTTSDTQIKSEKKIGYYVDSNVSGVDYSCEGVPDDKTGEDGSFYYTDGMCQFSVGNIILREVNTSKLEGNIVFEDNVTTARFLQTLDNDGNAENGIQIDATVSDSIASGAINLNGTIPNEDTEITALVTQLQDTIEIYDGAVISSEEAQLHLDETKRILMESIESSLTDMTTSPTAEGASTNDEGTSSQTSEEITDSILDDMTGSSSTTDENELYDSIVEGITSSATSSSTVDEENIYDSILDGMTTTSTEAEGESTTTVMGG